MKKKDEILKSLQQVTKAMASLRQDVATTNAKIDALSAQVRSSRCRADGQKLGSIFKSGYQQ
jgi:uncharacterized coiled-coil DUF342 family protein